MKLKKMKRSLLFVLLIPAILFVFVSVSHSQHTVAQLTNNANPDGRPQINNNGHVVWYGHDGSDYEIFLYDGASTTQLTNNAHSDWNPQINNTGYVVWYGSDGSDAEIFLYDGASTTQLTNNSYDDSRSA